MIFVAISHLCPSHRRVILVSLHDGHRCLLPGGESQWDLGYSLLKSSDRSVAPEKRTGPHKYVIVGPVIQLTDYSATFCENALDHEAVRGRNVLYVSGKKCKNAKSLDAFRRL